MAPLKYKWFRYSLVTLFVSIFLVGSGFMVLKNLSPAEKVESGETHFEQKTTPITPPVLSQNTPPSDKNEPIVPQPTTHLPVKTPPPMPQEAPHSASMRNTCGTLDMPAIEISMPFESKTLSIMFSPLFLPKLEAGEPISIIPNNFSADGYLTLIDDEGSVADHKLVEKQLTLTLIPSDFDNRQYVGTLKNSDGTITVTFNARYDTTPVGCG